jgi:hypothetical protein
MIRSPETFERSQVIALPSEQHAALLTDGVLNWPQAAPNCRAIVYNAGLGNYFFEFEPETDLIRFLSSAYLVTADPITGALRRARDESLRSVLPQEAAKLGNRIPGLPLAKVLSSEGQYPWQDLITEAAEQAIRLHPDFLGQVAVCRCDVPGCSAEYAWIEKDICLLYLQIVAVGIREVRLLPFRVVRHVDD